MALDLTGLKAATFNTPSTYKDSVSYYEQNLVDKINDTYQYASDTYEIEQESEFGSLVFNKLVCRVCHAIDPKTGNNLGDDFKDLKFFQLSPRRIMGERYRFSDSVWITTNTDNYHYNTQSAIVRRCNNTLNYINSSGVIIREPCIVGYSVKYANIYYNTVAQIPQGTIFVTVQNNQNTQTISVNDRFLLNNQVFKVKSVQDYLRSQMLNTSSVPVIELELFVDAKAPDDDFSIGVANMNRYKGIYPPTPVKNTGIVFSPEYSTVYQGSTTTYTCYYYLNGVKQNNTFVFSFSGADTQYYTSNVIDGNSFTITCLHRCPTEVVVGVTSGTLSNSYNIKLGGLY